MHTRQCLIISCKYLTYECLDIITLHVLYTVSCVVLYMYNKHTLVPYVAKAFLIYWKEEDSVSVTHRDDMVEQLCEPTVSDVVEVKYQRQVCEGMVAEVGTPDAIKSKEEASLRGDYTQFSHKRPASPSSELTSAKKSKEDIENVTPLRSGRGQGRGRGKTTTGRGKGTNRRGRGHGADRGRGGRGTRSNGMYQYACEAHCTDHKQLNKRV